MQRLLRPCSTTITHPFAMMNSKNKMNLQVANKFLGSHLFGGLHQILAPKELILRFSLINVLYIPARNDMFVYLLLKSTNAIAGSFFLS